MALHKYEGVSGIKATLIDGYLKDRPHLLNTAEEIAKEINVSWPKPYRWDNWDDDALFQYIAFNSRGQFCRNRPEEKKGHVWSEGWLLRPDRWENGYKLKKSGENQSLRRLLVGLYHGCACGEQCLTNLVERSGLEIISTHKYKNIKAFTNEAEEFLYEICLPFEAPCSIAEKVIKDKGYSLKAFGS